MGRSMLRLIRNPRFQVLLGMSYLGRLDIRNNGGGNIHTQLLDILTRRPFGAYHPRGGKRTINPGIGVPCV
mgnify:CR=1 FL=1